MTIAIGVSFLPYTPPVFERCTNIIHTALLKYQAFQQNPELEEPEKSFLVVALDLLLCRHTILCNMSIPLPHLPASMASVH